MQCRLLGPGVGLSSGCRRTSWEMETIPVLQPHPGPRELGSGGRGALPPGLGPTAQAIPRGVGRPLGKGMKYSCFSDRSPQLCQDRKASRAVGSGDEEEKAALATPAPRGRRSPVPEEAGRSVPSRGPHAARHIPPQRRLCLPLALSRSCYLDSSDFRGESQEPPRRAVQTDGFWGQTGWRPSCVTGGEKELEVRMALINALALGVRLSSSSGQARLHEARGELGE